MTYYIYKITNLKNFKTYVGQTNQGVKQRFKQHCHRRHAKYSAITRAIQKYGISNFKVETLLEMKEDEISQAGVNVIETLMIHATDSLVPIGYNIAAVGGKPGNCWEICPDKMREIARQNVKLTQTPEARQKAAYNLALSNGRYLLTSPDGLQFCTIGLSHLEELYSLDTSSLIKVARNKMSHHKGWKCISLEKEYEIVQRQYLPGCKHYEVHHIEDKQYPFCSYGIEPIAELTGCNYKSLQMQTNPTSPMFGKAHQGWSVRDVDLVTDIKPQYLTHLPKYELTTPDGTVLCIYGVQHLREQFGLLPESLTALLDPNNRRYGKKLKGYSIKKLGITPEEQLEIDNIQIEKEVRKNMNLKLRAAKSSISNSKRYLITKLDNSHSFCAIGTTHLKELLDLDGSCLLKVSKNKLSQHKGYKCELLTV